MSRPNIFCQETLSLQKAKFVDKLVSKETRF